MNNTRAHAARILFDVLEKKQSLMNRLPVAFKHVEPQERAFIQEICYGVLRWLPRLEARIEPFLKKKPKGKDGLAYHLLLVGVYQLDYMQVPPHAALYETVAAATKLTPRLKNLVNAVLRRVQQHQTQNTWQTPQAQYAHPQWLIEQIQKTYPDDAMSILNANNARPPMWIRVNPQCYTTQAYQQQLQDNDIESHTCPHSPHALRLEKPCPVTQLPGFDRGNCSVQDASAQLAAAYLDPKPNEHILDVCAAPGGKSLHLLQHCPDIQLTATDIDAQRLERVQENLTRANLNAQLICGDATKPQDWCSQTFDRILLDVPCSATGVIRRHPDIKWLRKPDDIQKFVQTQIDCLDAIWPYLRVGGTLLYVTCSILPDENTHQIASFVARTKDARCQALNSDGSFEQQILPNEQDNRDGFYFARLTKVA